MKRFSSFLMLICAALMLSACASDAGSAPSSTQATDEVGVVAAISSLVRDISSLQDPALAEAAIAASQVPFNAPGCPEVDLIFDLIGFSSTANLQALSETGGTVLARGTYRYDAESETCTQTSEGDDLDLSYAYLNAAGETAEAELSIDWDVDSATLDVANPAGDLVEVPTNMSASLTASDTEVASVSAVLSWYNADECGTDEVILEPLSARASGQIGTISFSDVGYTIDKNSLNIGASLSAAQGIDAEVELGVKGKTERENCYIDSFETGKGTFSARLDSTVQPDSHSLELDVKLSDAQFTDFDVDLGDISLGTLQGLSAVTLKNGKLRIDNKKAAHFTGVLDDSNANGVSGENVTINFTAGGSTDLESFLTENDFGTGFEIFYQED